MYLKMIEINTLLYQRQCNAAEQLCECFCTSHSLHYHVAKLSMHTVELVSVPRVLQSLHSGWPGVWRLARSELLPEAFFFQLLSLFVHTKTSATLWMPLRSGCLKMCTIILISNWYRVSHLSLMASFSLHPLAWPFGTAVNIFVRTSNLPFEPCRNMKLTGWLVSSLTDQVDWFADASNVWS